MYLIPLEHIIYIFLPVGVVAYVYFKWVGSKYEIVLASLRMMAQLLLVGYVLIYLFENDSIIVGVSVIVVMIAVSSLITLRNIEHKSVHAYSIIFASIAIGGSINLWVVLEWVLELSPLYEPKYVIPLAGMIYANAMNSVSLAAERFSHEIDVNVYEKARAIALRASLIPRINALLAVGLVSLPGMMTGQILSGVDPLIAVRYQIVVMAMILGSSGLSVIGYLYWMRS
ncbi:MAG: ABC transporter permease [Sulfurimonas sp.]|nr:MAG: ABC transporter permease [Sulfurimonas sp.]